MSLQLYKLNRYFHNRDFINKIGKSLVKEINQKVLLYETRVYNHAVGLHTNEMPQEINIEISEHADPYVTQEQINYMITWTEHDLKEHFKGMNISKIDSFEQRYKTYIRVRMTIPKDYFTIDRQFNEYKNNPIPSNNLVSFDCDDDDIHYRV